jgi:small subunit ribosomal protein S2
MLTNFQTIRKQIRRLKELERGQEESAFEFYTKKERLLLDRERLKLHKYLAGVKDMTRLPGAIFVVDVRREAIAVREADRLGIPVIAITDTNANPDLVEYPVPGNDDAIRSVGLITQAISQSVREASAQVPEEQKRKVQDAQATTYSTETGEVTETPSRPATPRRKRVPRPEILEKLAGTAGPEAPAEAEKAGDEKVKAETVKGEKVKAGTVKAEKVKAKTTKAKKVKAKKVKASSKEEEAAAEEGVTDAEEGATDVEEAADPKVTADAEAGDAESRS